MTNQITQHRIKYGITYLGIIYLVSPDRDKPLTFIEIYSECFIQRLVELFTYGTV